MHTHNIAARIFFIKISHLQVFLYLVSAQFASTDCLFRMSGAGSSVEAVWVSG